MHSKHILEGAKILAQILPNLPEKFLCDFYLQIFSHKDHEDLVLVTSLKRFSFVFSANVRRHFRSQTKLGAIFSQIFRDFG